MEAALDASLLTLSQVTSKDLQSFSPHARRQINFSQNYLCAQWQMIQVLEAFPIPSVHNEAFTLNHGKTQFSRDLRVGVEVMTQNFHAKRMQKDVQSVLGLVEVVKILGG